MDLIESPAAVGQALAQVGALYRPVYDTVYQAGRMDQFGSTSWLDMWSPRRTQAIQCDFCYMISPEHFRRFALPWLEYEMSCLDHAVYHMDGPDLVMTHYCAAGNQPTMKFKPGKALHQTVNVES